MARDARILRPNLAVAIPGDYVVLTCARRTRVTSDPAVVAALRRLSSSLAPESAIEICGRQLLARTGDLVDPRPGASRAARAGGDRTLAGDQGAPRHVVISAVPALARWVPAVRAVLEPEGFVVSEVGPPGDHVVHLGGMLSGAVAAEIDGLAAHGAPVLPVTRWGLRRARVAASSG